MRAFFGRRWLTALTVGLGCWAAGLNQTAKAMQIPDNNDPAGPEILNRGPIHEAFADPVTFDPMPGPTVPKQPPDPIEEQPPDTAPDCDGVQWISGYWAWDEERGDFIWISGIWRVPPPNCQWTPGYWNQCDEGNGGWRWTRGCWTPVDQSACQYLPAPPPSIERGPSSPPPSDGSNCIWTPGYWSWAEATAVAAPRYVWRPGCWTVYNPDWLWCPPRYVSTSCGYLFVPGFWDYPIERRGILYAPIYCPGTLRINSTYCPSVCINTSMITSCLFVQAQCQSYCFGDYFEARYSSMGIYPCYAYHGSRYGCDPIYAHCAASHFGERGWSRRLFDEYRYRREHPAARPPRIYNESVMAQHRVGEHGQFSHLGLATSMHELSKHQKLPFGIKPMSASQRQMQAQAGKKLHQIASQRRTEELRAAKQPQRNPSQPTHVNLPWSPIASRTGHVPGSTAGHVPGSTAGHVPGSQSQHPYASTTRHTPPPHPSYPQLDHHVQTPGSHYTPNRPEPHHDLPPPEHRTPSHPQYRSQAASQGHQPMHTVTRTGSSAPPSGTGGPHGGRR
jgi:hypothetical protein